MPDSPTSQRLGRFIETSAAGEKVRAFVPPPLPPEPAIDVLALLEKLSLAERALGRLDGITMLLPRRSEEHTSELQSRPHLVCRLLLEKKKRLSDLLRTCAAS